MKKTAAIVLTAILLAVLVPAGAEYQQYQLIAGDASSAFNWRVYALDAHNTVVTACSYDSGKPWHVTWYRDGEKYRDLTWLIDEPYLEDHVVPEPVIWDGEHLTVIYRLRKGKFRSVIRDGMVCPDPDNYEEHTAVWTENGLEDTENVPDSLYNTEQYGQIIISHEKDGFRIFAGQAEIPLPDRIRGLTKEKVVNLRCFPFGKTGCLLSYLDYQEKIRDRKQHVIAVNDGEEKFDVILAEDDDWDIMPDGTGGFFVRNGWPQGDYEPVKLTHYTAEGEPDRKTELKGDQVVLRVGPAATDQKGHFILYGTAMASSRRVYTVYRMTIDENLKVLDLDVRKIDPVYDAYGSSVYTAPDGTAYVMIYKTENKNSRLRPVLIPFDLLEKSEGSHGLVLQE